MLKGNCFGTCPSGTLVNAFNKTCDTCSSNCKECSVNMDECISCDLDSINRFLFGKTCLAKCPVGHSPKVSDGSTCIKVEENIVPFPFTMIAILLMGLIGIVKLCNSQFHFKDAAIANLSLVAFLIWIFLLGLAIKDEHWQSSAILIYAITAQFAMNIVWCK
jgi:hypothetical protein